MGAISKEKIRAIKKRDGNKPVVLREGGTPKGKPRWGVEGDVDVVVDHKEAVLNARIGAYLNFLFGKKENLSITPRVGFSGVLGNVGGNKIRYGEWDVGANLGFRFKAGGDTNWIAGAIKKPGALRASLGVKGDKPIPAGKLAKAARAPGIMGRRARLAKIFKGFKK